MSTTQESWCVSIRLLLASGHSVIHEIDVTASAEECRHCAFMCLRIDINKVERGDQFVLKRDGKEAGWVNPQDIVGADLISVQKLA